MLPQHLMYDAIFLLKKEKRPMQAGIAILTCKLHNATFIIHQ